VLDPSLQEETSARGKFSVAVDTNGDISYVYSFGLLDGVEMSKLLTIVKKTGKLLLDRLDHSIENDSSST
jgi:exosome complex RNA-binding protein Rrp42 (RNase PH superfamily)